MARIVTLRLKKNEVPPVASPDSLELTELVRRCQRELPYDTSAFEALVREFEPGTFRFCRYMLRDEGLGEDATQNTFIRVFNNIGAFQYRSRFESWLLQIARNECLRMIDQRQRQRRILDEFALETAGSTTAARSAWASAIESAEAPLLVEQILEHLSEKDAEILVLRHILGHSIEEIANLLEKRLSATKMALYRAENRAAGVLSGKDENIDS